jgi:hypothetical protein
MQESYLFVERRALALAQITFAKKMEFGQFYVCCLFSTCNPAVHN